MSQNLSRGLDDVTEQIYKLKQSRKGYFGSLTKLLNRASVLISTPGNYDEVSFITEKIEFAVFKINKITDEYCCFVSDTDQENVKLIAKEREKNANAIIISCIKYLETSDVASQVKSNLYGIESLFNTRKLEPERSESRKSKSIKDNTSLTSSLSKPGVSNLPNNSIEAKLLVTQTEAKERREIALSRKRQELEETEIMYAVEEANEKPKLTEILEELQNKGSDRNKHQ